MPLIPARPLPQSLPELPNEDALYQLYESSWYVNHPGMYAMMDYNFEKYDSRIAAADQKAQDAVDGLLGLTRMYLIQW